MNYKNDTKQSEQPNTKKSNGEFIKHSADKSSPRRPARKPTTSDKK
ncbi:hypothetical protein [Breznakia pachnodae]|uniref:Multidrug transporter n=1 Tax=Breznakia pachnodae TaxID=265178 RepID=A0ABU0E4M1_9FIRM|nr:hypothetical protein [Breznakia pachnodae]MDQ0361861.1 hypothetical protein [Breznakia pachnodae]